VTVENGWRRSVSTEPIEPKPIAELGVTDEFRALTSSVLPHWNTGPLIEAELLFEDMKKRPTNMLARAGKNAAEVWTTATGLDVVVKRIDRVADVPGVEIEPERELRNEVAAYRVADALGWTDLVPPTVYRKVPTADAGWVDASVQLLVSDAHHDDLFRADEEQTRRAAVFDFIIGAKDRLPRNWMFVVTGGVKKFVLIDNGWSFSYPRARPFHSAIWETFGYKAHSLEAGGIVVPANAVIQVRRRLRNVISPGEIEDLVVRMRLFTNA
jgi:hypothetical protein